MGHLFYATSSLVQHFVAIGEFKLELQSGNTLSGSNSTIFRVVWPWNLTNDLEKQQDTSPKQHQAICIISSSYVNSNWSYSPETVKLGCDLCDLDLWPLNLTFCMNPTLVLGDNSIEFHDDTMMGTKSTRRSENDNTPQPLDQWTNSPFIGQQVGNCKSFTSQDQWTNSPFIGQQVGNCKSFTLTHYLADLFVMHCGPRPIPLCIQHHIQLTSLSFQVSQTSHSWVTAISIFCFENPRSRSWVRSKFEVTMWV